MPKRLLEIRDELIQDRRNEGGRLPASYQLTAHMQAERLYTIEQRIAKDHKREHGVKMDNSILPIMTQMEFEANEEGREKLVDKLQKEHGVNLKTANLCTLEMIRYKEKHGMYLTDTQKSQFIALSKQLVSWGNDLKREGFNSNQIAFLQKDMSERMQDGGWLKDNPIKGLTLDNPAFKSFQEVSIDKMKILEPTLSQRQQALERQREQELSLTRGGYGIEM